MESVVCTGICIRKDNSFDEPVPLLKKVEYLPFAYPGLTPYLKEKAERELNENEENIKNGLAKLKELIAAEPIPFWTDDDFLMLFLRAKKYDIDRSFQQLKNYSEERYRLKDALCSEKLFNFGDDLNPKLCGILPIRDEEGRAILYFSAKEFGSDKNPDLTMSVLMFICQFALTFPATQVSGVCFIIDASIPSVEALQRTFRYLKIFLPKVHKFPARFKRIDCINTNAFFRAAFNIIKTLLPSKMLRRVTLHGDQKDSLLNIYPPELLPEEFGGTMGTLSNIQHIWMDEARKVTPKLLDSNKHFQSWYEDD